MDQIVLVIQILNVLQNIQVLVLDDDEYRISAVLKYQIKKNQWHEI